MDKFQKILGAVNTGKAEWLVDQSAAFTMGKPAWFPFPWVNILTMLGSVLYGFYSGFWIQGIIGGILGYLTINLTPPFIAKTTKSNLWLLPIIIIGFFISYAQESGTLIFIPAIVIFISQKLNIFFSTRIVLSHLQKNIVFAEKSWNNHSIVIFLNGKMYGKHREDELIEEINNLGEISNDMEVSSIGSDQLVTNTIKSTSSGIQFLFIFGIIGFAIYGGSGSTIGWITSGLLLIGLIIYTKKSNKVVKQTIEKKELEYFIIPMWRFFIMQFLTAGFYGLYWSYKNLKNIGDSNGKVYSAGNLGISFFGPYRSILGHFWKMKPLVAIVSIILNLLLIIWPILQYGILQSQKNQPNQSEYEYSLGGIFAIPKIVTVFSDISHGDPLRAIGLYVITLGILGIFFLIISFPVILAQFYAKKYHKKKGLNEFTAKFGYFEGIMYILLIGMIYLSVSGEWDGTLKSKTQNNTETVLTNKKNEQKEIFSKYISSTGSFEVMTPEPMEYNRTVNDEDGTKETIDAYKTTLKNEDVVFMIIHDSFKGKLNLEGFSVKDVYDNFIKSYTIKEKKSYEEINGEAHFEILVEYEKQNIYFHGRIIKKNNNEVYSIYSAFSDLGNKDTANKFINSFKFSGKN